jgi:PAS domain S-box-containing protein
LAVTGDPFALFGGNDPSIFKVAIETSSAGTLVCDDALTILFSNRRIETLFGYAPGGLVGRSLEQLLPEVSKAASSPDVRAFGEPKAAGADGERVMRGLRRDGSGVPVDVAETAIARNGRRLVIFSLVDATERQRPQEEAPPVAADDSADGRPIADAATTADAARFDAHRRVVSVDDRSRVRRPESRLQPGQVVAESAAVRAALRQIEQVAATTATVLLTGETGSGKEVFAQAIHDLSSRQRQEMVRVNCAAIPAGLLESELFGHERGAYTGAVGQQIGRFEQANRSTIFLDEIGELSLEGQVKLLRVLQTKQVERLGSGKPVSVDIRIIVATNKDLERAIEAREFREDLYYRLNIFPIHVPALRERIEDIPMLVWTFLDEIANACGKRVESISRDSMTALQRYAWPGNVRELRNVVERAVIVATGPHLVIELPRPASAVRAQTLRLDEIEIAHIHAVLDQVGWRIRGAGGAADLLGLRPTTLESRMAKHGILRASSPVRTFGGVSSSRRFGSAEPPRVASALPR